MFVVHRAAEGAVLARALVEVLRTAPADPFAGEVVAVPARGVERWLAQRLSHVLGSGDRPPQPGQPGQPGQPVRHHHGGAAASDSPMGTRETLYTAATRAVSKVRLIGWPEAVDAACKRPAARATGLASRLQYCANCTSGATVSSRLRHTSSALGGGTEPATASAHASGPWPRLPAARRLAQVAG